MRSTGRVVFAIGAMLSLTAALASAQATTSTTTETRQVEVIAVDGNDIVVRMEGTTRQLTVPEDFRFTVDGTQVSVHELRPGMTGTATITSRTTITPVTVTEVKNGTVAQVGGGSIVLRTDEGLKSFTQSDIDKRGIKIVRDGRPAQLSDFRTGDTLTATIITTLPPATVTERDVQANLASPAAPIAAAATAPAAGASPSPAVGALPTPAVGTSGASELPKTGGILPLIGLAGLTSLAIGASLARRRRRAAR
jgi:LPXTG-motif cell wall-anchored protein